MHSKHIIDTVITIINVTKDFGTLSFSFILLNFLIINEMLQKIISIIKFQNTDICSVFPKASKPLIPTITATTASEENEHI